MGLIKAAAGAAGGVLADQWKEFFTCEALPANVLAVKGQKKTTRRSSNMTVFSFAASIESFSVFCYALQVV